MLAQRLQAQGVAVEHRLFPGTTHEFYGADGLIPAARDAQQRSGERLRAALYGTVPDAPQPGKGERG